MASPPASAHGAAGTAPAGASANVSLREPFAGAAALLAAASDRRSRQYCMRPTASWHVSATSRHVSPA